MILMRFGKNKKILNKLQKKVSIILKKQRIKIKIVIIKYKLYINKKVA